MPKRKRGAPVQVEDGEKLSAFIPAWQARALEEDAQAQDRSVSAVLRAILRRTYADWAPAS